MMSLWTATVVLAGLLPSTGDGENPTDIFLEGPRMAAPLVEAPDRIDLDVSLAPGAEGMQAFFDQGLVQWYGGWPAEAARSFQTILIDDPDCAMAYWGLALANERWPARAAWFARAAWLKKGLVAPLERKLIDALARYHGVDRPDEPAGLTEPWNPAPGEDRMTPLVASEEAHPEAAAFVRLAGDYGRLATEYPSLAEVGALRLALVSRKKPEGWALADQLDEDFQSFLEAHPLHPVHARRIHFWLSVGKGEKAVRSAEAVKQATPAVGKSWFLAAESLIAAGRPDEAFECVQAARRLSFEQSRRTWQDPSAWLDPRDLGLLSDRPGLVQWEPRKAPAWTLPDAYGKEYSLKDYRGKPVLVVYFLGFGCVHCLEQLQAIEPLAARFEEAGIAIVAIGLQSPKELRVSLGDDPDATGYSFPILCDPSRAGFRSYGAYDDFADTELHGTYLLDADGRVTWSDISHLPYMEVEALLDVQTR